MDFSHFWWSLSEPHCIHIFHLFPNILKGHTSAFKKVSLFPFPGMSSGSVSWAVNPKWDFQTEYLPAGGYMVTLSGPLRFAVASQTLGTSQECCPGWFSSLQPILLLQNGWVRPYQLEPAPARRLAVTRPLATASGGRTAPSPCQSGSRKASGKQGMVGTMNMLTSSLRFWTETVITVSGDRRQTYPVFPQHSQKVVIVNRVQFSQCLAKHLFFFLFQSFCNPAWNHVEHQVYARYTNPLHFWVNLILMLLPVCSEEATAFQSCWEHN